MKWRDPSFWFSAVALIAVVVFALWDSWRSASPGPLSRVHANVPELEGASSCERCHGEASDFAGNCSECHAEVGRQLSLGTGLHGTTADADRCQMCHSEHHGFEFSILGDASFLLAGVSDPDSYDHGHVDFGLTGRHAELECSVCHPHADAEVVPHGEHRYLGLDQTCEACHEDPHKGRFDRACVQCHGQEQPFAALASFVHTEEFPLTGVHASSSCRDCHVPATAYSLEGAAAADPTMEARSCGDCHESSHREEFIADVAADLATAQEKTCRRCHVAMEGGFSNEHSQAPGDLHAVVFPLGAPHESVSCAECHQTGYDASRPTRSPADCGACHLDPHGDQFTPAGDERSRCVDCHSRRTFEPHLFGLDAHAGTAFPLTGAHVDLRCSNCHERPIESSPRRFVGTTGACADCHADAHAGLFEGESCAACHSTDHFSPARSDAFRHGPETGFVLDGAHERSECTACHVRGEADEMGRTFGRIADLVEGSPSRCDSCHDDLHDGRFDEQLTEGESCDRCHGTSSFQLAPDDGERASFDHAHWTGFVLDGAHERVACADCHDQPRPEQRLGRAATECASCHTDPHAGVFGRSCESCHTTSVYRPTRTQFDHQRWTGFGLIGAHEEASCDACHPPLLHPEESGRTFAAAVGSTCSACHVDPHAGQFATKAETDCARCHAADRSFEQHLFDHADARFVLDERHAELACSECHKESRLEYGATVVRYKPLGTLCSDCHGQGPRGGVRVDGGR